MKYYLINLQEFAKGLKALKGVSENNNSIDLGDE